MELDVKVYRVRTEEGLKDYFVISDETVNEKSFNKSLHAESIVGVSLRLINQANDISPDNFARNPVFVEFMHKIIADFGETFTGLKEAAKNQQEGIICIIDGRTPTPQGPVPPEDIIGIFKVTNGLIIKGSYMPNPNHLILSEKGFFQLHPEINDFLLAKIKEKKFIEFKKPWYKFWQK